MPKEWSWLPYATCEVLWQHRGKPGQLYLEWKVFAGEGKDSELCGLNGVHQNETMSQCRFASKWFSVTTFVMASILSHNVDITEVI